MRKPIISHVAICGAGTMGAQLAASFANSGCTTYLFDVKADTCLSQQAIKQLKRLHPAPLCTPEIADRIIPANYDDDLALLPQVQLVIEAVSESLPIKISLLEQIIPHIQVGTFIGSNTSGLSIEKLAESLPTAHRPYFLGTHFFNPPRYLSLIECIPSAYTDPEAAASLYRYCTDILGKSVLIAPDSPNFIANRVGVFSLLLTAHQAERFSIAPEVVDALTGTLLHRPKSATYRTADVVGLDILSHAVHTSQQVQHDPWRDILHLPAWIQSRIDANALGQKTGKGLYEKRTDGIYVYDPLSDDYRPATQTPPGSLVSVMKKADYPKLFPQLYQVNEPHHRFLWATLSELFHYCAWLCHDLSISVHTLDQAVKKGYGWELGPFEMWQQAGVQDLIHTMERGIVENRPLVNIPLPEWLNQIDAFYQGDQAYHPKQGCYVDVERYTDPCYSSHLAPTITAPPPQRIIIHESSHSTLWTQDGKNAIFSINTTLATMDLTTIMEAKQALEIATKHYQSLIIWPDTTPNFGAGADLKSIGKSYLFGGQGSVSRAIDAFQDLVMAIKYAPIPCIAAVRGLALGGSCELMMHCAHRVASYNSYIGLVEAGVGLIPAAGGCKEMALYALQDSNPEATLQRCFTTLAMGKMAMSAQMAKQYGFLRPHDTIVAHDDHILAAAHAQANAMNIAHYTPPVRIQVAVPGSQGIANLSLLIANMQAGHFATEHDAKIASSIASVLCGGEVTPGTLVDESYFLALEKERFLHLLATWKTKKRIAHMLQTGKRLSN